MNHISDHDRSELPPGGTYPQDTAPDTVYQWSGHNELCDMWVEGEDSWHMDRTRACTCGGTELPAHLKTEADILLARAGMKPAV